MMYLSYDMPKLYSKPGVRSPHPSWLFPIIVFNSNKCLLSMESPAFKVLFKNIFQN